MDEFSTNIESRISTFRGFEKFVPAVARFLLIATFFEDGLRMFWDWDLQVDYIGQKLNPTIAVLFLVTSAAMQLIGAVMVVISHSKIDWAVYTLLANIVLQALIYGIFNDPVLMLRNCALIGGLLMLLSEKRLNEGKKAILSAPITTPNKSTRYLQLAGRTLLVLLLVAHMPLQSTESTVLNIVLILICVTLLGMVVVGLKTRLSALLLVVVVCVANIVWNNFWMLDYHHPERDFFQYYFFQTLSIIGGLLLLFSVGPGDLSMDEHKKRF